MRCHFEISTLLNLSEADGRIVDKNWPDVQRQIIACAEAFGTPATRVRLEPDFDDSFSISCIFHLDPLVLGERPAPLIGQLDLMLTSIVTNAIERGQLPG